MMPPMFRAQKLEEESLKECDCEPWFLGAISENTNSTLDQVEEEGDVLLKLFVPRLATPAAQSGPSAT